MSRTPTAPRPDLRLCRICGRPDYLDGLCYRHYKARERGPQRTFYSERQQDQDNRNEMYQACGCLKNSIHTWDCADNPYREVGEEYVFRPEVP